MSKSLRDKLKTDILLLDGAFGTYIQSLGLTESDFGAHPGCMEHLVISKPELIARIHRDYLEAGADAVETDTFGGNALKLGEYGLSAKVYEINREAAALARREADRFSARAYPRYVIGTMGPTGKLPSSTDSVLGDIPYDELKKMFMDQALGIIDGGADALLVETSQDLLEMKAALNGAKEAIRDRKKDIVLMAQSTLANNGRMLLGTEMSAVSGALGMLGVDVIGLNCSTGPAEMEGAVKFLSQNSSAYVSCVPNAGLPEEVNGGTVYPLGASEMAELMARFVRDYHVDIIGGCCGTTPDHIRQMRKNVRLSGKRKTPNKVFMASSYKGYDLEKAARPIKVGERINTQGSKKTKDLLIARDYDGIVELGKTQQKAGADILDVCAVLTERPTETRDACIITSRLAESVTVPLMIDSTDVSVIEAALKKYPGTAFINSANLEDGGEKARKIFAMAREYGAFTVNLVIDQAGMARTVERKLEIAEKLIDIARKEYGIPVERLAFDLLTFTLATGEKEYRDAAVSTLEAIKQLKKKHPGVLAALGVSNISFGLGKEARRAVNASFLHHAVKAGLDLAIINPAEPLEYEAIPADERKLADDLVLDKHPEALARLVDHFALKVPAKAPVRKDPVLESAPASIEEKLKRCIFDRDKTMIVPLIDEALKSMEAHKIINDVLMDAMKEVGRRLDSGEMVLPYVLQSAEVMRKAIEYLDKFLPKGETGKKGKVLLATVAGDVHDIGKNLVKMILENNGFDVVDLGKQVPVETIVEEAAKHKVDAVGLSALLVSTARHMKTCVQSMHDAGMDYPVMIGGAPINDDFASGISVLRDGSVYKGGVFYARDAFTGLRIMQALTDKAGRLEKIASYRKKAEECAALRPVTRVQEEALFAEKPAVRKSSKVPVPPFYGPRTITNAPADEVFKLLDERMLFEFSWAAKLGDKIKKEELIGKEYRPLYEELKEEVLRKGLLELKAVYGYFRARVSGTNMDVIDEKGDLLESFTFERSGGVKPLALTDYFTDAPGELDLAAFQAVTVGRKTGEAIKALEEKKEYTRAFFLHGLSVNIAEALASYVHARIRRELGLSASQGKRYSPGYPLWRNMADQEKLFRMLDVEKKIGVSLTEDYQMVPEASTTAMVVYNDKAEHM